MSFAKKKGVSLKDIAREAGVSPAAASFVLNGKQKQYRVSDEVAARIRKVAEELDYTPNGFAKSLRDGTSHTIGVIVSDISNQFFADIVRHIETYAEKEGYMALFASSDENAAKLSDLVDKMLSKEVDGMILVPCTGSDYIVQKLVDKGVPLVLIDRYIHKIKTNYVCLNNRKSGHDATTHLIRNGYSKIGFVCYGSEVSNMKDRAEGYRQAMTESGHKDNINVKYVDFSIMEKSCRKAIDSLMESGADAVVFATNSIAVQSLYYINERGIRIPDDLGVVSFDGGSAFDFFYAPLTYIVQPLESMAKKAVEILLEHLHAKDSLTQQVEADGMFVEQVSSRRTLVRR